VQPLVTAKTGRREETGARGARVGAERGGHGARWARRGPRAGLVALGLAAGVRHGFW
jgi:hypothetical protein